VFAVDVNILVYAHREEEPGHHFYKTWLENLVSSGEPFGLTTLVALAFVRIVTHPRFPHGPTPLPQALAVVEELQGRSGCQLLFPAEQHWSLAARLLRATQSTGAEVGDAQHAAIAMEYGCIWVTRDRDFEKWRPHGLKVEILEPGDSGVFGSP